MTPKEHYDNISTLFYNLYEALEKCADECDDVHAEETLGFLAEAQAVWLHEN